MQSPNFKIQQQIGTGASARVYDAIHIASNQRIALKVFHAELLHDRHFISRIESEVKVIEALKHPNIVSLVSNHLCDVAPSLAFELIEGESLQDFKVKIPFVLPELSLLFVIEILKALEYSHSKGIIHRDIKPNNILISKEGTVKVADFGLAKVINSAQSMKSGTVLGSPDFMSPEQARGDVVDERSDLFSLSALLYTLVTGVSPFQRDSVLSTLAAVNETRFESPRQRNPKISYALCRIIDRGLQRDPNERYESAATFLEEIRNYLRSVGLQEDLFTLSAWMKDPNHFIVQSLKKISETLIRECDRLIRSSDYDQAQEILAHLSLVAPSSEFITKYTDLIAERSHSRKSRALAWWYSIGSAIAASAAIAYFLLQSPPPDETPIATEPRTQAISDAIAEPVTTSSPSPTPKTPISSPAVKKQPPPAMVTFILPEDVQAKWDGKPVKSKRLQTTYGSHQLTLIKKGHPPIQQKIEVSPNEPTVIRVGAE